MAGFNAWQSFDEKGCRRRVVDVRWLFDTVEGARRYHRLQMKVNSERGTESSTKCQFGEGGKVFTPPDPLGAGLQMEIYLFTVRQVGVKLFFANIPREQQEQILARALTHVGNALECGFLPEAPPPQPPHTDERWPKGELAYETLLAGQPLLPGKGIGNVLTFEHVIADMYKVIGGGEEVPEQPFVYFFKKGSFAIAVRGEFSLERNTFPITHIRYWDDPYAVLKTPEGISVGNTREDVRQTYGPPLKEQVESLVYGGITFRIGPSGKVAFIDLFPIPAK